VWQVTILGEKFK